MRNRNLKMKRLRRVVAEVFDERRQIYQQKRQERRDYNKAYKARKALETALAAQRNSAFPAAKAPERTKLPTYKQAAGGKP
jgi:hypothetical protein